VKKNIKNKTLLLLLISLVFISSCSTKKKAFTNRKYHNITAKYNGYFNGKESLKYGIKKLEKAHTEDYSLILPTYKTKHLNTYKSHHAYMDKSIKKGSIVIQKHSIKIKGKEYCKWIDDSYFLVAKAYFYKGEFDEARKTFEYIRTNYKKSFKAYESTLWIARCLIEKGDLNSAESELEEVESNRKFPEKLEKEYHTILSSLYLKQKNYALATDELKTLCNSIKRKSKKVRYFYILAQIYQDAGDSRRAKKYYELVIRTNPEYEMVFNAKMNLARSLRGEKDLQLMRQKLYKMTKDEKNKEYLDQIYYTLAEMDMLLPDTLAAIDNYLLSTKMSIENDPQKSVSFLSLGKISYNKSNYVLAKEYYDSAYVFMPEDHLEYREVKEKQSILEQLVFHLNTIKHEDSLQTLAIMDPFVRKSIIQSVISELIRKEQEEMLEKQNRGGRGGYNSRNGREENFGNTVSGGKWYFYNPATLSFGMSEFKKKWGKRKLEDDWRRSNKKSINENLSDSSAFIDKKEEGFSDKKSEKYYLDQLPTTKEQLEKSDNKIINAYYQASVIYNEDLNEKIKSDDMLTQLIGRFPFNNEFTPLAYYSLYLTKVESKKEEEATQIKNLLIKYFPKSNYAKMLLDSNFIKNIHNIKREKEQQYNTIFQLYTDENFQESYNQSEEKLKEENKYESKYFLINILSEFKLTKDTVLFREKIKKGISIYANTDESKRCQEILVLLNNPELINKKNLQAVTNTPYILKENTNHYNLIITQKEGTDINYIKTLLSDYHSENYSIEILDINAMLLGMDKHLLIVRIFPTKNSGMKYFYNFNEAKKVTNELNKYDYKHFVISEENFKEFYKHKDIKGYIKYFEKNYLQTD